MNTLKRTLALLLTLCMVLGALPLGALGAEEDRVTVDEAAGARPMLAPGKPAYSRIIHLDCGRKYFTPQWIKALITEAAADGYTHVQLALGNDGMRFLLDDMSLTVDGTSYTSQAVAEGIREGNRAYHDFGTNELTQSEMDGILAHAKAQGVEIIPLINTPGHMDAILYAANRVLGKDVSYSGSVRTVDVTNAAGVAFTKALVGKYIAYFAGKGCTRFNIGADEYANDVFTGGGMGFGRLVNMGQYGDFVTYLNGLIALVKNAGMTPMAFNDGIYYEQITNQGTIDPSLQVCYWSSGWSGYNVASASYLAEKGFPMVNTHGDFYYVVGKNDQFDNGFSKAAEFDKTRFSGSSVSNPVGSMFCIWCDFPAVETEQEIARKVRLPMRAMADAMDGAYDPNMDQSPVPGGFLADGSPDPNAPEPTEPVNPTDPTDPAEPTEPTETVELTRGSVTVAAPGLTDLEVTEAQAPVIQGARNVLAWDVVPRTAQGPYTAQGQVKIQVPPEWAPGRTGAFLVNRDGTLQYLRGEASGSSWSFTVPHFSVMGLYETEPRETGDTVTMEVTQSQTRTQNGLTAPAELQPGYDENVVRVEVQTTENRVDGTTVYRRGADPVTALESGRMYLISSGSNVLSVESPGSTTITNSTVLPEANGEVPETQLWLFEGDSQSGYSISREINGTKYYLWHSNRNLLLQEQEKKWEFDSENKFLSTPNGNRFIGLSSYSSEWRARNSGTALNIYPVEVSVQGGSVTYDHTITFTGVGPGKTQVTVGDITYHVTVRRRVETFDLYLSNTVEKTLTAPLTEAPTDPAGVVEVSLSPDRQTLIFRGLKAGRADILTPQVRYQIKVIFREETHDVFVGHSLTRTQNRTVAGAVTANPPGVVRASAEGSSVTFQALREGTAAVVAGDTRYTIHVIYKEKPITLMLTGQPVTDTQEVPFTDSPVYSQEGIVTASVQDSTVTFAPVAPGTAQVTLGDTRYTVTVTEEDLTQAPTRRIEFWITNRSIDPDGDLDRTDTDGTRYVEISPLEPGIYGENGLAFDQILSVPPYGTIVEDASKDSVRWRMNYLDGQAGNEKQTHDAGSDSTLKGQRIGRIRYWQGQWSFLPMAQTDALDPWIPMEPDAQTVAYYLQSAEVTTEVATHVVDWAEMYSSWQTAPSGHWFWHSYVETGDKFCYVDWMVVYEDGTSNPAMGAFPVANTGFYHAAPSPRKIGAMLFTNSSEYEIWKITTTDGKSTGYSNADTFKPNYDEATETIVWDGSDGSEPHIDSLTMDNQTGKLIRLYVRAKPQDTALGVHYINVATGMEFYGYGIQAKEETLFDPNFALVPGYTDIDAALTGNTVVNSNGVPQTVTANLAAMPAIGPEYRYSSYTCTRVERSGDGMDVYLYYKFDNNHDFVIDFGLPLTITAQDLGLNTNTTARITGAKYGTAAVDQKNARFTYTPREVLQDFEHLILELTENESRTVHDIYIYPASTIYYEEGFAASTGFEGGSRGTKKQQTQRGRPEEGITYFNFGYDTAYSSESGMSAGTEAQSTAPGSTAVFTFHGTGMELYMNCGPNTGMAAVILKNLDTGAIEKFYQVDTAMKDGTSISTVNQEVTAFSLPVVSIQNLPYGAYEVTVRHIKKTVDDTGTLHLDGFRIFDSLNFGDRPGYPANEYHPEFTEIRDMVIGNAVAAGIGESRYATAQGILDQVYADTGSLRGAIILQGAAAGGQGDPLDFLDNGPKNELFLYPNQAVTFNLGQAQAQIGMKSPTGTAVNCTVNGQSYTVTTSTDLFYHPGLTGEVTIANTSSSVDTILSLTLLKVTGEQVLPIVLEETTPEQVALALMSLGVPTREPARAVLEVELRDWRGELLGYTELTAASFTDTDCTFSSEEIAAAARGVLPAGCALAEEPVDVTVAYGETEALTLAAGREAVLRVDYVRRDFDRSREGRSRYTGRTVVGTALFRAVETGERDYHFFSGREIAGRIPRGFSPMGAQRGWSVVYGQTETCQVMVR